MNSSNLWAPWRMQYIRTIDDDEASGGCFLCEAWNKPDEDTQRLVLHREAHGMLLLNRFPYTNGHLLIAPSEHLSDLPDLTVEQRTGLMELTTLAERLLRATVDCQGMNVGMNIGRCAGAGLPGHLHVHVVPRWNGDGNFMSVVGQVRVIPQALEEMYEELSRTLPRVLADPDLGRI